MSRLVKPVGANDHTFGPADASVTLVEYGDYECPYCGRAQVEVSEVLRNLGEILRFTFRHFPLSQVHPHAVSAAQAAEAAAQQGKFWPMHATLFENQEALEFDDLVVYSDSLGLDVPTFTDELRTGAHLPKISDDFRSGVRSGVNGTPTFFINGVRHDGSWSAPDLIEAIWIAAQPMRKAAR